MTPYLSVVCACYEMCDKHGFNYHAWQWQEWTAWYISEWLRSGNKKR